MAKDDEAQRFREVTTESITEIKINQAKHEASQERMNEILAKLTQSVEYHILRSDKLEELVELYKTESRSELTKELEPIKSHVSFMKGVIYALGITCAVLASLHQMGILQKLL